MKRRVSRDEMNLAEFPLAILSTRADPSIKTLEFKDTIRGKNGELTERCWIITGADKFGLPTASDDEVLLGLLKLSVDSGLNSRKVVFTRYELMKILHWSTEGRNYSRLQKSLDRLSGVRIKAKNGFYDNDAKAHCTKNFGIIDEYEINDGRDERKPSFFTWSEVLFNSFQVGFIKKLDLDFYLSLRSAVSKRLYRYLDKHFWYKPRIVIDLFLLAHEKIGISRNYKYLSSIRQQIDPAVEELVEKGFIKGVEYEQRQIIFKKQDVQLERSTDKKRLVLNKLIERGVREGSASKIVYDACEDMLSRIEDIIDYFDKLKAKGVINKNPAGFLFKAVSSPLSFSLPSDTKKELVLENPKKSENREAEYLTERKKEIAKIRSEVEIELLKKTEEDVRKALSNIAPLIGASKFEEAVRHGVDEKLASLFALPSYQEWLAKPKS